MRKLTKNEKDRKISLEGISSACNCSYRCRPDESSASIYYELYRGSTYGGGVPVGVNREFK